MKKLLKCMHAAHKWPPSLRSAASVAFSNAYYSALCSIPLRFARVYKLKLAFVFFFFSFFLFEVGAEQVPLRKIREITLYRADVFLSLSLPLSLSVWAASVRAGDGKQSWGGSVTRSQEMERERKKLEGRKKTDYIKFSHVEKKYFYMLN